MAIISTLVSSCCAYVNCSPNDYARFRILRASNGEDLVFGPNRLYDKDQIKFYSLHGTDTTFFNYAPISGGVGLDSLLYVNFSSLPEVAYIRLSSTDIDTLLVTHGSVKDRCCGTFEAIKKFRYNNALDVSMDAGVQELKK